MPIETAASTEIEQWRHHCSLLSQVVRDLQESEQAAWRAADEAREAAVRCTSRELRQAGGKANEATQLRAELAKERQASTHMQQLSGLFVEELLAWPFSSP